MAGAADVKQAHRAMWASGDYPYIALEVAGVSEHMVRACGVRAGQRVLDVAAGTGSSAIPAASLGAEVVASDLTPELFDAGRARAREAGVELEWVEADAESLPFGDAEFDVVMSAIGAMFAPDHRTAAREMLRVTRAGGTIGMANWTPGGTVGQMFATLGEFAPPPPPGAQPPPLWGTEDHVREMFGDGLSELRMERHVHAVTQFETPREVVDTFKVKFGPVLAILDHIGDDRRRLEELDATFLDFVERHFVRDPGGSPRMEYEYLLVVGTRAG